MYSFSGKNWEETSLNKRVLEKIKVDNNYSELVSKLVLSRGFQKSEINTINGDINIYNPFLKEKDFIKTAKILDNAIRKNEKIIICNYIIQKQTKNRKETGSNLSLSTLLTVLSKRLGRKRCCDTSPDRCLECGLSLS